MPNRPRKPPENEEPTTIGMTLRVHTTSREEFKIDLGKNDEEQVNNIMASIVGAFNTVVANNSFLLTDTRGVHYVFNTNNVTGVEITSN